MSRGQRRTASAQVVFTVFVTVIGIVVIYLALRAVPHAARPTLAPSAASVSNPAPLP